MTTRRLLVSALGIAAFLACKPALAQCLTGGDVSFCDDPLSGNVAQATVVGGTLLSTGGFRVDAKGDHVTLDLGAQASSGTIRFTVSGVSPANLNQDTHLVLLATDTKELKNPAPTRVLELKIWGDAVDPNAQTTTLIGAGDGAEGGQKSAGKLSWSATQKYTIEVSWNDATQRLTFARNGVMLVDFKTGDVMPGTNNPPVDLRYRYVHFAMPYMQNAMFWPVMKSVYGMYSVRASFDGASSAGDAGTPDGGASGGTGGSAGGGGSAGEAGSAGAGFDAGAPSDGGASSGGASSLGGMTSSGGISASGGAAQSAGVGGGAGVDAVDDGGCSASARHAPFSPCFALWLLLFARRRRKHEQNLA